MHIHTLMIVVATVAAVAFVFWLTSSESLLAHDIKIALRYGVLLAAYNGVILAAWFIPFPIDGDITLIARTALLSVLLGIPIMLFISSKTDKTDTATAAKCSKQRTDTIWL